MTLEQYLSIQQQSEERYTQIIHRPSMWYFLYKVFVPILLFPACLLSAGYSSVTLRYVLLGTSFVMFFIIVYQFLTLKTSVYIIGHDRLRVIKGVFDRIGEKVELYRIRDVKWQKPLLLRFINYGIVTVYTTDKTAPVINIPGVKDPEWMMNIISDRVEYNRLAKRTYEITNM